VHVRVVRVCVCVCASVLRLDPHEGVMAQVKKGCNVWMSHEHKRMSHLTLETPRKELCQIWRKVVTYEWVLSRTWMSHPTLESPVKKSCQMWMCPVTHLNESCRTPKWATSYPRTAWRSHVTDEWGVVTHEWVMSPVWMSRDALHGRTKESCHVWRRVVTYEWVVSLIWMSHVTSAARISNVKYTRGLSHVNESYHLYEWVMPPI